MTSKNRTLDLIIPKLCQFIAKGTDVGNIIFILKGAGFNVSFDAFTTSQHKSKQDFLHELLLQQNQSGNLSPFLKLSDLILVKEYFRPGDYDYQYDQDAGKLLTKEIKTALKNYPSPPTDEEKTRIFFGLLNLHKGIAAVSSDLFSKNQYEQAVAEASKFFENYIQNKIKERARIGVELMGYAFGGDQPKLSIARPPLDDKQKNEQKGFLSLALGEVQFLKNRLSHRETGSVIHGRAEALKLLGLLSFLLEQIDHMSFNTPRDPNEINIDDIPF